jgi:tellurite resistance protein
MLLLASALLSSAFLLPLIFLGMAMAGYNTYKFFRANPLLGRSGTAEAITGSAIILVISALIVAIPHGFLGKAGLLAFLALGVNVVYTVVALYYLQKWFLKAVRGSQDELTQRAAAFTTSAFQKSVMGLTALLLGENVDAERKEEIVRRIGKSKPLSHLPTQKLLGIFRFVCSDIESKMFGWESAMQEVRRQPGPVDQKDVALRVAIAIVGGKNGSELDAELLERVVEALNLDIELYRA